mmetsp:Transcript_15988/g.30153  ORF Transcript_15988/g.30153 Transcript_15988/m.30153 type:complete len:1048 (-) Transcript_15988:140-3283(-)|eukprot:CAMPEP_0176489646 /NCGR_PEP_ID=MMETSP0200_2-20121128/7410_1 /TAXON_ID=947934 /ORGANISM="Chaetoceros sp., Strain GSL56" /LENGTH=1047 /DNA_ID=CAMNT_0017886823 /DNA_START=1572 /DNA_END=4718 /DNA_ORIENTATION=+
MSEYNDYAERIGGYKSIYERLAVTETQSSVAKRVNSPQHENRSFDGSTSSRSHFNFRSSSPSPSHRSIQPSISSASSSRMIVSPKIFDRLAATETYASAKMKGKIKEQRRRSSSATPRKTSMAFFERLAYTETFASAQMKGLIDAAAKREERSSSRTRSVKSMRSEARGESFWDRMSKTETYASLTLKGNMNPSSKPQAHLLDLRASPRHFTSSSNSVKSAVSPSSRSISGNSRRGGVVSSNFFDRLSKAETVSSIQKRRNPGSNSYGQRTKTPDSARMYHNSNRSISSADKKLPPSSAKAARKPLYYGTSNSSVVSSQHSPRSTRTMSPSARSVGTARSATAKSVATTRSVTTSRSLGNTTIETFKSNNSMKSSYSTPYDAYGSSVPVSENVSSLPSPYPSYLNTSTAATQQRRLPPPSPKTMLSVMSSKPLIRDKSSSPRALSVRQNPSRFTSTNPVTRVASKAKTTPVAPAPKPNPPPRPVLKFDDDDDELSFGSEGSDEASLGPSSISKAPQDAGSVASKSMASKKSTNSAIAELTATTEAEMASVSLKQSVTEDSYAVHDDDENGHSRETSVSQAASEYDEDGTGNLVDCKSMDSVQQRSEVNTDEYCDSIERQSVDENEEEGEEDHASADGHVIEEHSESKSTSNPRIAVVHESDDELSFGSDDGEDDWMNGQKSGEGKGVESKDTIDDVAETVLNYDDEYEAKGSNVNDDMEPEQSVDSLGNRESTDYDDRPSESMQDEEVEEYEEEEDEEEGEETSYKSDAHRKMTPEASDEIQVTDEDGTEKTHLYAEAKEKMPVDYEEESESHGNSVHDEEIDEHSINEDDLVHAEYDNEDDLDYGESDNDDAYHLDAQQIEEEYDEEDDLEQMDSLDLILDATKSKDSKHEYEARLIDEEGEFDDKIVNGAQESSCKYKILKTEKYHPEYGVQEIFPDDLYLKETLECFERGEISNEEIAVLIIEALFERDFSHGEHWEIDDGIARELDEDEGGGGDLEGRAFAVKRQARLDWNDLYSVAASKGNIVIVPDKNEIRVENYSYFVAG